MQLFGETHIDFMKYRKFWIVVSLILVVLAFVAVFLVRDLNVGIDFAGGTQVTLKFKDKPNVEQLRELLGRGGLPEVGIQRFGTEEQNEIMLRTRTVKNSQEGSRDQVVAILDSEYNRDRGGKLDLNNVGTDRLAALLASADPERRGAGGAAYYRGIAEALLAERRVDGIFTSWDEIAKVRGATPAVTAVLQRQAYLGSFSVEGVENVGPQIGEELRRQGFLAVALSLLGMMVYIWFRFELRFGIGAIMACVHDVLVTLGLFTLARYEFNLTTIAAFLTLIGYSVNDTVVIFDRIRENMRKSRREPLIDVMNKSINQSLSRTILTGGLTLLTVIALWYFGNDTIKGFAFVMGVGIIVGTYSSCYVASPFTLLWENYFGSEGKLRRAEAAPVRGGSSRNTAEGTDRTEAAAPARRTRSSQPARRRR